MEDREDSIASSADFYGPEEKPESPAAPGEAAGALEHHVPAEGKRKADDGLASARDKRTRLVSPAGPASPKLSACAGLPPAVWQRVFLFCPLKSLGRLLQVNRSFHSYLTAVRTLVPGKPPSGFLRLLKSESIWASARNMHPTKPPRPLAGFSELDMWQLIDSPNCQFCGKASSSSLGDKIWQHGPGADGVRIIWPFAVRTCGTCLMARCQPDSRLLFSKAAAARPALPFAFITSDKHYIPAHVLQTATTPASVEIARYYYDPVVEELCEELDHALSLGPAAAEEWSKGLEDRGKKQMRVAETWERWEVRYRSWKSDQHETNDPATISTPLIPQTALPRPPTGPPPSFTPRGERNLQDANDAKASRRLDIERRCQLLAIPIPPNVLRHMDSFKAALQIPQPMNDYAWEMLEPRLRAQLPAAQQAEAEHAARAATLSSRAADRRQDHTNLREAKDVLDREWEEVQRPIRDRLAVIADEFINNDWDSGKAVTYESSPKFAVDLFVHVRRRYYADRECGERHGGADSAAGVQRPKLVLDNMKWVYDNKIKPVTEQYRKELFLCNGNSCENNTRFYGFEGVLQHFAAKHTNTFSVGNVVVAWRDAEWPEETPFHPDPIAVKQAFYPPSGALSHGQLAYPSYFGGYSRGETSTPQMQPQLPYASPGPYGYNNQQHGPFVPPPAPHGFDYGHAYGNRLDPHAYPGTDLSGFGSYPGYSGYATSPALSSVAVSRQGDQTLGPARDEVSSRANSYDMQVSTSMEMAKDLWKQTSGIKDFPNSVRIYVVLHRIISKFHVQFNHEPSLNHLINALSNHQTPKSLKNAPGLSCRACQDGSNQYPGPGSERRTFTALNLLQHFQSHHGPQPTFHYGMARAGPLDWKEDMIELPSDRIIRGLVHAAGMDDEKLRIIATVFPMLFPPPLPSLPRMPLVPSDGSVSPSLSGPGGRRDVVKLPGLSGRATDKSGPSSLTSGHTNSPKSFPVNEDEYDPLRPALSGYRNDQAQDRNRKRTYEGNTPPEDRRPRHSNEARYYLPREAKDEEAYLREMYMEDNCEPSLSRRNGHDPAEPSDTRAIARDERLARDRVEPRMVSSPPRGRRHIYQPSPYLERPRSFYHDDEYTEYRLVEERAPRGAYMPDAHAQTTDADEGHRPELRKGLPERNGRLLSDRDINARTRYSPQPLHSPGQPPPLGHPAIPPRQTAPSTVSNGSRYDDHRGSDRQVPTPDSAGQQRRSGGIYRRRERPVDTARYSRYAAPRDEHFARGASISRAQSKRYEQQRRRIDQQETPQPSADMDAEHPFSRDQSADLAPADDGRATSIRPLPRGYVSMQDRGYAQSYSEGYQRHQGHFRNHSPPPIYVNEYGEPIREYEVIRVPRPGPGPSVRYYEEYEPEPVRYVPVSYGHPMSQRYDSPPREYVYHDARPPPPPGSRTMLDRGTEPFEATPVEVKVENPSTPVPTGPP